MHKKFIGLAKSLTLILSGIFHISHISYCAVYVLHIFINHYALIYLNNIAMQVIMWMLYHGTFNACTDLFQSIDTYSESAIRACLILQNAFQCILIVLLDNIHLIKQNMCLLVMLNVYNCNMSVWEHQKLTYHAYYLKLWLTSYERLVLFSGQKKQHYNKNKCQVWNKCLVFYGSTIVIIFTWYF